MELSIISTLNRPESHMKLHSPDAERLMMSNGADFTEKKSVIGYESSRKRVVGSFQIEVSTSRHGSLSESCANTTSPFTLRQDTDVRIINGDASELPLVEDFIDSLRKCKTNKHLPDAKNMYSHICSFGLEAQDDMRSHILVMFLECGSISSAQRIFNIMSFRTEISWTSLIIGYVQSGRPQTALDLYPIMQEDSVHASGYTLVALLKACASLKDLSQGQEIHVQIVHKGLEYFPPVGSALIRMYAVCHCIVDAEMVFHSLPSRDLVSWTALLSGYVEYGLSEMAIDFFEQMKQKGITPDAFTIACILKAYGNVGDLEKGRRIHKEIGQIEIRTDLFVGYSLVNMYAKCGALVEARQVFDELPVRGIVLWNSLIGGYANNGFWQEALECYELMQSLGVCPDAITFTSVLKACGSFGGITKGRYVHIDCIQKGFEGSSLVGNSLVSMYAKCGSLAEAEMVFKKFPCIDVVSWTILISGYAEYASFSEALGCFDQMQETGISPNTSTFASMLKACGNAECIDIGRKMHMVILKLGLETSVSVGNSLVSMYGKFGLIEEAQVVFDNHTICDSLSWTLLVAAYGEHGSAKEAVQCFNLMRAKGVSPDPITFSCVFQACGIAGDIKEGLQLHLEIVETELCRHPFIINSLISMYVKCGLLVQAREVFDNAGSCDTVAWTTLISGYADFGPSEEAIECFEKMQLLGIFLDSVLFACALKACGSIKATSKGFELHMEVVKRGYGMDSVVGNTLVSMYAKCGLLLEAQEMFSKLLVVDRVSWNALIAGFIEYGPAEEALVCFELMQLKGVSPDAITFTFALKACIDTVSIGKVQEMHSDLTSRGLETDSLVSNMLVIVYASHGSLLDAQHIFDALPLQELPTWYALIAGYAEHGPRQEALQCLDEMQKLGVSPDAVTYASALKACGSIGAMDRGLELHKEIAKRGHETDDSVSNNLVAMYAKCDALLEAEQLFDNLSVKDVVAWSSMIQGYGLRHECKKALQCYEDMQVDGVMPNALTFTCLLVACNHSNLVYKGIEYLKSMSDFDVSPTIEHYTSMINLFAKSEHSLDAERFVEMICPPCEASWATLLSACRHHADVELGWRCFQHLVCMRIKDAAWCVLLADIYASTGSWLDAYRVEDLRRHVGAVKKPGIVLIEVDKNVHEFVVSDMKSEEISSIFTALSSHVKADGCMSNLSLELVPTNDDGNESILCGHAEKLAIAFGLINTPEGRTLRMTKNLRMCNDCHEVGKMVSRLERREILLRDTSGIHQFKEGLCSCEDML